MLNCRIVERKGAGKMIAGLLILSFFLSSFAALLAGLMGLSFIGALGVYIACGFMSAIGFGIYAAVTSRCVDGDAFEASTGSNNPVRNISPAHCLHRRQAGP